MNLNRFRKLPVVVEATDPWDGTAAGATPIIDWVLANGGTARYHDARDSGLGGVLMPAYIAVDTLDSTGKCYAGDRIIRGTRGEFYPCKPAPFADTFEPADESSGS